MTFGQSISVCFSKYANFDDRAAKSEYWWFYLFGVLINFIGTIFGDAGTILTGLVALVMIVPSIAVGARRLHDTGKSGWHQLWVITIIGIIPLIIWLCTEGSKEANKFGDPIDLSV